MPRPTEERERRGGRRIVTWRGGDDENMGKGAVGRESGVEGNGKEEETVKCKGGGGVA